MSTKKIKTLLNIIAVLTVGYALPGRGTVVHVIDVAALLESSDLIVSARVTSISEQGTTTINMPGGPIPGKKLLAVLALDETLKGSVEAPNLSLEYVMPEAPSGIRGIPLGQYGIFFLRRGTSTFTVSDPVYPFLPAVPGGRSSNGSPLDRVTVKLGEVLTYGGSSEFEIFSALDALGRLKTDLARDTLRHALSSPSRTIRLDVARTLVAGNDMSGLGIVEDALLHPSGLSNTMISNLAGSLGGLKDPLAVPALKRLLETNNQDVIKGAAIALRQSGSADALVPLSQLLDNGDERVRYYAVVGMGEITRQDEWTPAFTEFRDHEAKYLSYWRDWAASNLPRENPK